MKKRLFYLGLLLLFILSLSVYSQQSISSPGVGPSGTPGINTPGGTNNSGSTEDPEIQRAYQAGYKRGYRKGYRETYDLAHKEGVEAGRKAGSEEGKKDGRKDGKYAVLKPYYNLNYGPDISTYSDKNMKAIASNFYSPNSRYGYDYGNEWPDYNYQYGPYAQYYRQGYDAGYYDGRRDGDREGYNDGFEKGKSETYKKAYKIAYDKAFKNTKREVFYKKNGDKKKAVDFLKDGIVHFQGGEDSKAKLYFNIILKDFPQSEVAEDALWYVAQILMRNDSREEAAVVFIRLWENSSKYKKKAGLEAVRILYDLKTGGFIGIGRKHYYKKSLEIINALLKMDIAEPLKPELLYYQGYCYEGLKMKDQAKACYKKVVDNYKTSPFYEKAKKRLKKLDSWWHW